MNFALYIAQRYLFTKSSNNAINIITIIAAIGVFAGAFSLIIVLSGFSGLREFSLSFSNEFDPDLKAIPETGKTFQITDSEKEKLHKITGLSSFSEVIEERVFLSYRSKNNTAFVKGVDENYRKVNNLDSAIVYGTWLSDNPYQVVAGNGISRLLSLGINDYQHLLGVLVPKPGKGAITNPNDAFKKENVVVTGIYSLNEELDNKYIFSTLGFARNLLSLDKNQISALEFKLKPGADASQVSREIKKAVSAPLTLKTRAQLNDTLYKMLNTENLAVYLIFTLVLVIALFNVIGSIIMVILDKRENIKTLYSLGADSRSIRNIFFMQGSLMTIVGGIIGLVCGLILVFLQQKFAFVMITPSLPYPVKIKLINILIVFLTIGLLGILASYIAASQSKKALTS